METPAVATPTPPTPPVKSELMVVIEKSGLEPATAASIQERFLPFFQQAQQWRIKAEELVVTDASHTKEMKMAREARLILKDIRVESNKTRIALKEDSNRYGKAVQTVYNFIEGLIAPIENILYEKENFVKIQEEKRLAAIKKEREEKLAPYNVDLSFYDLVNMSETLFSALLEGTIEAYNKKIEDEKKAEQDRLEKERKDIEEREKQRKENEKLKAEAKKRELEINLKNNLRASRMAEFKKIQYVPDVDVAELSQNEFATLLMNMKTQYEIQLAEKQKQEEVQRQLAKEKAEAEEKLKKIQTVAPHLVADSPLQVTAATGITDTATEITDKELLKKFLNSELEPLIARLPKMKTEQGQIIIRDVGGLLLKVSKYLSDKIRQ